MRKTLEVWELLSQDNSVLKVDRKFLNAEKAKW